ncbi:Chaperone protein DnaJ [Durusdinium trenchii]|uniref:Chaperone protein DnaJ n=1 Tax=Durusdinium trenchii TaxID=1381693 RepID=A0ABP0J4Y7_9DINO
MAHRWLQLVTVHLAFTVACPAALVAPFFRRSSSSGAVRRFRGGQNSCGTESSRVGLKAQAPEFEGISWSSQKWLWEVQVACPPTAPSDLITLGAYETQRDAAKAADVARLALEQLYPPEGQRSWTRNLPKETIYQDEVEEVKQLLAKMLEDSQAAKS